MTTLRGNSFVNSELAVTARDGARVDLPQVSVIEQGKVQFSALGSDSVVELPALTRFAREAAARSSAPPGGRIFSPKLIDLDGVWLTVDAGAGLDTSQIVTLTSGGVDVTGVAADFTNLVRVDGASLTARDGGVLALPNVASYAGDGLDFYTTLRAEGAGSVLDLSGVTALAGNTFVNDALIIQAVDGGALRLPNVAAIDVGMVQFEATGDGSRIDLSSLRDFRRGGRGGSSLRAAAGAAIDFGGSLHLADVDLFVETRGVYTLTSLALDAGARLLGGDLFPASVTNAGEVAPDLTSILAQDAQSPLDAGTLHISGGYSQTVTGTLSIEIAGPLPVDYDRIVVDGAVQLGGTLSLTLLAGYDPAVGTSFTVLSGSSINGAFDEVTGAEIDEARRFEVNYVGGDVVVTVVAQ
ncbi:MAG: hypothetical protein R2856_27605 [Caldilineaceae bacterium]